MSEPLPLDTVPVMAGRPFTRAEALAGGIDQAAVRSLVRRGQVRRIVQGVYVDSAVPDSLELRAEALAKVLLDDSVICRQTAAWLYGDVVDVAGLRVTSPTATAVHLARRSGVRPCDPRRPQACAGYDSDLWHSTFRQQLKDARRSQRIEAEGWVTLSVGRGQVWGTDPALEYAVGDLLEVRPRLPRRWVTGATCRCRLRRRTCCRGWRSCRRPHSPGASRGEPRCC